LTIEDDVFRGVRVEEGTVRRIDRELRSTREYNVIVDFSSVGSQKREVSGESSLKKITCQIVICELL
jgi:hypothetical protein